MKVKQQPNALSALIKLKVSLFTSSLMHGSCFDPWKLKLETWKVLVNSFKWCPRSLMKLNILDAMISLSIVILLPVIIMHAKMQYRPPLSIWYIDRVSVLWVTLPQRTLCSCMLWAFTHIDCCHHWPSLWHVYTVIPVMQTPCGVRKQIGCCKERHVLVLSKEALGNINWVVC